MRFDEMERETFVTLKMIRAKVGEEEEVPQVYGGKTTSPFFIRSIPVYTLIINIAIIVIVLLVLVFTKHFG